VSATHQSATLTEVTAIARRDVLKPCAMTTFAKVNATTLLVAGTLGSVSVLKDALCKCYQTQSAMRSVPIAAVSGTTNNAYLLVRTALAIVYGVG